ncbi:RHS repeat domain-containing protein [Chryseobacterium sp. SIMBA_029]|uniref:RHS repeat domain-containing protein n=1 Tax=Chryseobacterium sp. SIMBA_029 TaxID=3085772 RepID=UPI00397C2A26
MQWLFLNAGDKEKEIYWFHPDHLGSSSYITGLDGEVTQNIEYFPSGEVFVENHNKASNNSPYKFNGKELDAETAYYYYGARYYNPRVSLWLNVDPLAEKMPSWSPYVMSFNNPVRFVDPDGRAPLDIIFNLYDVSSGKYREYARIKSEKYNMDVNISAPYPVHGISLAPDDSQRKTYGNVRGVSGQYQFDEFASVHGDPDAFSVGFGGNLALGKGYGAGVSVGLMMKGPDSGKAGVYATGNTLEGAEASVGVQVSFMFSDVPLSKFDLTTLEGYAEGRQAGVGLVGVSTFESYSGEYKYTWNYENYYIPKKTFVKDQLLYHGYTYGLGVGPEDVSASASTFSGDTSYLGEVTNLIKTK